MSTFLDNWLLRRAMSAPRGGGGKYIQFADPEVERICIANFSSDGIGVTYEDAAAVTDLGLVFKGTSIASFDELQYFTGLTALAAGPGWNNGGDFGQCGQLVSITLPDTIMTLGAWCFGQCVSLTNLVLPDSVTTINTGALYNTAIHNIEIPVHVTTLGETQSGINGTVVMRPTIPMPIYRWGDTFPRNANLKIYVPYSADHSILNAYKATSGWADRYLDYLYELNPDGTIPS